MREHLIPGAREPRPIVNSGGATDDGGQRDRKRVAEGIFLAKIFFFTVLTLLMKRIARMDLTDGFSTTSGLVQDNSARLIKFRRFEYISCSIFFFRVLIFYLSIILFQKDLPDELSIFRTFLFLHSRSRFFYLSAGTVVTAFS